ncbi:unnamed protein product, partial [Amoebophrya sp. A25]
ISAIEKKDLALNKSPGNPAHSQRLLQRALLLEKASGESPEHDAP